MLLITKEDKLLNLLERIAIALEKEAGIENFPSDISLEKKSSELKMFTPDSHSDIKDYVEEVDQEFELQMKEKGKGFFFEEDVVSQETLEKM